MTSENGEPEPRKARLTRRDTLAAAFGLTMVGLAGSAIRPHFAAHPTATSAKPAHSKKAGPPLKDWPTLDALADRMVREKLTPGLSLSVAHKGTLLYSKGFGIANLDTNAPVTPQTGFRIASITKQFTAASILLLAEAGKLSIEDNLSRFLPDFPRAGDVTLRQLLSHTSGLGDYINGQDHDLLVRAQQGVYTSDEIIAIIRAKKPLYRAQPGATWLYSNSGFALLGIIVERVSGMAFADFTAKHLFTPAGLENTAIDRTCVSNAGCNGYRPDYTAAKKFDLNLPVSPSFIGGAGAIRSTTEDLCQWHTALLSGKILKPHSLRAMLTPVMLKNGTPAYEHRGADPMQYGLGMGLGQIDNLRIASHGGRVNGFTGHLHSFPDEKLTVAILYNSDGGGAPHFSAIQKALRTEASKLGLAAIGVKGVRGDDGDASENG